LRCPSINDPVPASTAKLMGMLMKKTQRQLSSPVRTPPSNTPTVMPSADMAP
jgi:hypothetical protein